MKDSFFSKILGLKSPQDKIVDIFKQFGNKGKLLDAPCGYGHISKRLEEIGFEVIAVDINPQLFCFKEISCEKVDLNQDLPFKDESFHFVLCSNGIEHLEDPFHFIRECYRILKKNGKILITTPNILNLKARLANLLVGFNHFKGRPYNEVDSYKGGEHINLANYYEIRINLHRNGFKILEATTHKFSNTAMLLFPLVPFVYSFTYRAFKREKNKSQMERNKEILKHVLSADLLFGKKLFILAEKDERYIK